MNWSPPRWTAAARTTSRWSWSGRDSVGFGAEGDDPGFVPDGPPGLCAEPGQARFVRFHFGCRHGDPRPWRVHGGQACDRLRRVTAFCFGQRIRSEEHTSELQSLMRISYAVFRLKKKKHTLTLNSRDS